VLLAEDNLVNQKLAAHFLTRLGHQFSIANNGLEALQLLDSHQWDLILMDLQMPEMDGEHATRLIRQREENNPRYAHQRIIAMTAHAMKGDEEFCLEHGFDGYIAKPVSLETLHAEMARVMALPVTLKATETGLSPDRQVLATQLGIDDALLSELLSLFAASLPEVISQLKSALSDQDPERVRRLAHKIRGEAATFGFLELVGFLQEIEDLARQGALPDVSSLHAALTQKAQAVQRRLRDLQEAL
jgi:CheY-like chemotaxis protein